MVTARDAGVPRNTDLPTLDPGQIDALVDELITHSSTVGSAEPMTDIPARSALGPSRRWSGRAGLLAVACVVAIIAIASVASRPSAAPSVDPAAPVTQAPAPNFPCEQPGGTVLTDRAVYLPNPTFGARTLLGMVGDQVLCTEEQPSGVTAVFGSPKPGPVPYFALTGDIEGAQLAYGVADGNVTRVRFIPNDAARPTQDAAALIAFGDDVVFYFPGIANGVVRFYRGNTVIAEEPVGPVPYPMIAPTSTGQACDPTGGSRPDLASLTLTDANGRAIYADIYPEPLDPGQPAKGTSGRLCLLVQWAAPAVSVSAHPLDSGQPLAYLAQTPAGGGTFIWGRLTGTTAKTVTLTDTTGIAASLPAVNLDSSHTGQVSFATFIPATAARIVSVQAVNSDGDTIGEPVRLP